MGDIAEVKAVKKVFTDTKHLKMNATKSMIGHCLGAAGGMEVRTRSAAAAGLYDAGTLAGGCSREAMLLPPVLCSGDTQAIATIKAIETGWVHPTLNQVNLIDEVSDIDTVPNEKKQHKVRIAALAAPAALGSLKH